MLYYPAPIATPKAPNAVFCSEALGQALKTLLAGAALPSLKNYLAHSFARINISHCHGAARPEHIREILNFASMTSCTGFFENNLIVRP